MKRRLLQNKRPGAVSNDFIISVKTDNVGTSSDTQFTIPTTTVYGASFNYDVTTSDGQTINGNTGDLTITFPSAGTYDINISGQFGQIFFANTGDKLKLLDVKNWGAIVWDNLNLAFQGCANLDISATDVPDTSICNGCSVAFRDCTSITSINFDGIDMSNIAIANATFLGCTGMTSFSMLNPIFSNNFRIDNFLAFCSSLTTVDFETWDASKFIRIDRFFDGCSSLTSILVNSWQLTNCTRSDYTFQNCESLVSIDLSNWDVSNFTRFDLMFFSNSSLTTVSGLQNWVTTSATLMGNVFNSCPLLTIADVTGWNLSSVSNISAMFRFDVLFDYDLSGWDVTSVTNATNFLANGGNLSTSNYDALLISWGAQAVNSGINIHFGDSQYTLGGSAETARNTLINTHGWTITDGGGI